MILYPNAKINIGLNVLEKREDGFHNLETLFYPVGVVENPSDGLVPEQVVDVLEIVEAPQLQMHQYGIEYPGDSMDNLCVKAYKVLRKDFDIPPDVESRGLGDVYKIQVQRTGKLILERGFDIGNGPLGIVGVQCRFITFGNIDLVHGITLYLMIICILLYLVFS